MQKLVLKISIWAKGILSYTTTNENEKGPKFERIDAAKIQNINTLLKN